MKQLIALFGSIVFLSVFSVPLLAHGPAHMRGPHLRGHWGAYQGCVAKHERQYKNISEEQRKKLVELDQQFFTETEQLRNEIMDVSHELHSLLGKADPEPEKAKTLQKRLSELRAMMDAKRLAYTLKSRKILPESRSMYAYGWGYHHQRRGYRSGKGYGPRSCWQ